jgi:hypothetical protein
MIRTSTVGVHATPGVKRASRLVTVSVLIGLSSVATHEARANLVLNDSFEDDGNNLTSLFCPISDWTASLPCGTGTGEMNAGETSLYDPGLDGHSGYLAIGTLGQLGEVSQAINTVAGQTYEFTFSFSGDGILDNQFEALWGGAVVMDVTDAPYDIDWGPGSGDSDVYSFTETATATSTTIAFLAEGGDGAFVGVDDVSVDPVNVPEPASLALFGMGLAALGLVRRRKRKTA